MDNKMTSANLIDILAGTREISDEELIEMLQGMADEIPGDDTQIDVRFAKLIIETAINRLASRSWKPIDDDTPKDTAIMLYSTGPAIGHFNTTNNKWWTRTSGEGTPEERILNSWAPPTHWHPLLAAPKEAITTP